MTRWKIHKYPNLSKGGGERSPFFHQAKTNRENFVDSLNHGQPFLRLMKPFIDSQPINRPYNMKICTGKQQQVCACALAPARMQPPRLVVAAVLLIGPNAVTPLRIGALDSRFPFFLIVRFLRHINKRNRIIVEQSMMRQIE